MKFCLLFLFFSSLTFVINAQENKETALSTKPKVLSLPNFFIEKPPTPPRIISSATPIDAQVEVKFPNGTATLVDPVPFIFSDDAKEDAVNAVSRQNNYWKQWRREQRRLERERKRQRRQRRRQRRQNRRQRRQERKRIQQGFPPNQNNPNPNDNQLPPAANQAVVDALLSSESGVQRTTAVGLTVQPGATGEMGYRFKVKAINGGALNAADQLFRRRLLPNEQGIYDEMKRKYTGGLNVPMLEYLGADLSKDTVTKQDLDKVRSNGDVNYQNRYNELSKAAKEIMNLYTETEVEVDGTLKATHTGKEGEQPISVFAFVRFALVKVDEQSSLTVLSTDNEDVVGGNVDADRENIDSEGTINILVPTRR